MLCLSRRVGERILIGNGVLVEVLEIRGHRVRLGLIAPSEVRILRAELAEHALTLTRELSK